MPSGFEERWCYGETLLSVAPLVALDLQGRIVTDD